MIQQQEHHLSGPGCLEVGHLLALSGFRLCYATESSTKTETITNDNGPVNKTTTVQSGRKLTSGSTIGKMQAVPS
jgi:hypothetical protein